MKNIKCIFIFLLLFFVSGCTANYKLNINNKLEIEETLILSEKYEVLLNYTTTPTSYINEQLSTIKLDGRYNSYLMNAYTEDAVGYGTGIKMYSNLNSYKTNSLLINDMFKEINTDIKDGVVTISMIPNDKFEYFEENSQYSALLENVVIEISLPFKVINNNASEVNKNIYKWNISKGETLKEVNLSFDSTNNLENKIPTSVWIIIFLVSGILIFIIYVYIRYKINSK